MIFATTVCCMVVLAWWNFELSQVVDGQDEPERAAFEHDANEVCKVLVSHRR